ncbi:MAG: hypothetical protein E7525_02915 [Ruminococcaceae bacterium]|nr:hypothetical protein [Oscillospiraceae bacterium]
MIRGINKRVIEINDIGSEYFEKAFLIVKDNKATVPNLEREADRVMQTYFPRVNTKSQRGYLRERNIRKKRFALCVGFCVLALAVTAVVLSVILI